MSSWNVLHNLHIDKVIMDGESLDSVENIIIDGNIMSYGSGNDLYIVNSSKDIVIEEENSGIDTVSSLVSYTIGDNIENLILEDTVKKGKVVDIVEGTIYSNCTIYGNPTDNRWILDTNQNDNGAIKICQDRDIPIDFEGTCVITSIENVLIMAGKIVNQEKKYSSELLKKENATQYENLDARQDTILRYAIDKGYCHLSGNSELGSIDISNIYSNASSILNKYGVSSYCITNTDELNFNDNFLNLIAQEVKAGKVAILTINSDCLYEIKNGTNQLDHAITITGVAFDDTTGNVAAFYICDSGASEERYSEMWVSATHLAACVHGNAMSKSKVIITDAPIKPTDNNTYGIGNELDNEIKGNSGNNILIGNTGNDKLYGGDGKDFLIGGSTTYTIEELQNLMQIGVTKNAEWDKFVFGDTNAYGEAWNILDGGNGNDILVASSEFDTLTGGKGNDTLVIPKGNFIYTRGIYGGEGNDTYIIGSQVENLLINDDDMKGRILFNGHYLYGSADKMVAKGVWVDEYNNRYVLNENNLLTINNIIKIKDFANGNLSINLGKQVNDIETNVLDPLVLDLDGDGIELISMENSNAYFDLNGDGIREKVQWVSPDDGLLVLDKNADGQINGIDELFGNPSTLGFDDLKQYDLNNDNIIDTNDVKYSQLRVWQDLNSDGVVDSNELKTLQELNIAKINLNYEDGENTTFAEKSTIEFSDGTTSTVQDINLEVNFANTKYDAPEDIPENISALPQIEGSGAMKDLHTSMLSNSALQTLVSNMVTQTPQQIYNNLDSLLKLWAGVDAEDSEMRGLCPKYIVEVVEQYYNEKYSVEDRFTGEMTGNVNRTAGVAGFKSNYKHIKNSVFAKFIIQTGKYECFSDISYNPETKHFSLNITETALNEAILDELLNATDADTIAIAIILDNLRYNYAFDFDTELLGDDYTERQKLILSNFHRIGYDMESEYNDIIIATQDGMTFNDYSGSDIYITKDGDNTITDYQGSNEFYLGSGNDNVHSESSTNAIVKAGAGNDSITILGNYFTIKDNIATIYGEDGNDNITVSEVYDVMVSGGNGNDSITVNASKGLVEIYGDAGDDILQTGNYETAEIMISGGDGNDQIYAAGTGSFYGDDGADIIYISNSRNCEVSGGTGNDSLQTYYDEGSTVCGDEGDDTITIRDSEDTTVSAGEGNDNITVENSSSTIVFNLGDGEDNILLKNSDTNTTTLKFGPGITWADLVFNTETITKQVSWTSDPAYAEISNNLIIRFKDSASDKITIKYWYGGQGSQYNSNYNYCFDSFEFSDGTTHSPADIVITEYVPIAEDNIYTFNTTDKLDISDSGGNDKIVFGENITLDDLEFYRVQHGSNSGLDDEYWSKQDADDLYIKSSKFPGDIIIRNYYTEKTNSETGEKEYPHQIESLEFTDGTIIGPETIEELRIISQTAGDDYICDKGNNDIYHLVGNDTVYDTSGNDIYYSISGNQNITDIETKNPLDVADEYNEEDFENYEAYEEYLKTLLGNDTYNLGSGNDTILDLSPGYDIINSGAGYDNITVQGAGTVIVDAGSGDDYIAIMDRENSSIHGDLGNDNIYLQNTTSTIANGDDGDDIMYMSNTTSSILSGGSGYDTITVEDSNTPIVYGEDDSDTINITGSSELYINGDGGDDYITVNDSNGGVVNGGAGEDGISIENSHHITINGQYDNDAVYINNSESITVYGDSGNDYLTITDSSGTISGGVGNDNITVRNSDAEIIFNRGDGQDIVNIENLNKNCTLTFGEGISWDDLEFSYVSEILNPADVAQGYPAETSENMVIKLKDTTDQIVFKKWYEHSYGPKYYIDTFKFADGTTHSINDVPELEINGTNGNDTLTGTAFGDIFNGGNGNDTLIDKGGDDIYIFNPGDGQDIIKDEYGNDTIQFGEGITPDDVEFYRIRNTDAPENVYDEPADDLLIKIKNTTDQILIKNYYKDITNIVEEYSNYSNTIETIKFANGTTLNMTAVEAARIIPQTAGDDYIYDRVDDSIYNLVGNDTVIDTSGNDIYNSTSGNQYIVDTEDTPYNKFDEYSSSDFDTYEEYENFLKTLIGNDTYNLGSGNDTIIDTSNGNDVVHAGAGDDNISVKEDYYNKYGTAIVYGEAGNDTIEVEKVSATISGGTGNDRITVIETDTTFLFNSGDGQDILLINNAKDNSCTLKFGEGISWEDLEFSKITETLTPEETGIESSYEQTSESMVISIKDSNDKITVRYWFGGENGNYSDWNNYKIDNFEFADGTIHSKEEILLELMNRSYLEGTDGNDNISGTAEDDIIYAKKGNDTIVDYYDSNDYYIFNSGDGKDIIKDYGGNDTISFGEGISKDDIILTKNNNDLIINIKNSDDQITIQNWGFGYDYHIETLKFSDGSTMTNLNSHINNFIGTDYEDTITGNTLDNIIDGGAGADTMIGDLGDDTYIVDNVNDTIIEYANEGIDTVESSVTYTLPDNVENITLTGTEDIDATGNRENNIITGNSGANLLHGNIGNDTLYGGAGKDILYGDQNDDILIGGTGNDTLLGGSGNDTYMFELNDGVDIINDLSGENDCVHFGSTIDKNKIAIFKSGDNLIIDYGDSLGIDKISILGQFSDSTTKEMERFELSDGSYMDINDINNLIQNMTAYAQNNAIEFTGIGSVKNNADLMNLVASSWHS